ncbi:hypothetical protein LTR84_008610 [Exophiala bonariae]|uniref:GH16 domain-containing protein n=1 Tax=Exophiala bonariae TaxID=1690606 RepID=A0AAV9N017_9EURO|nr:hypothetical protein LTR84_008610 [Exophiala bonariae]
MIITRTQLGKPSVIAVCLLFVATCLVSLFLARSDLDVDHLNPFRGSDEIAIPDDSIALRPAFATASVSESTSSSSLSASSSSPTTPSSVATTLSGSPSTSSSSPTTSIAEEQDDQPNFNATSAKDPAEDDAYDPGSDFREIYSLSRSGGTFFPVSFGNELAYNLNILPHPEQPDQYVLLAQAGLPGALVLKETTCIAEIHDGILACIEPAVYLEPTPSISCVKCVDGESPPMLNMVFGPRDARMFNGPEHSYIMYGSQSQYTWLGLWIQNAGRLIPTLDQGNSNDSVAFPEVTEIQRPPPTKLGYEKNYFLFWDDQGTMYAHHDIFPNRTFAQLSTNGSVGADLSLESAPIDTVCMAKHMPKPGPELESVHQSTNSLALTLCRRADPSCSPSNDNTFIITIFQHKTYHYYHALYYSYVMLFQQAAPFAVHGISSKPLWIHGRDMLTNKTHAAFYEEHPSSLPPNHTEMFYITSISWKSPSQRYHGYIDDALFVSFGIEDTKSGTIDVLAGDLIQDLAYCDEE